MKLEDEIKQARFENELQKAVLNIKFTASWLSGLMNATLKPYAISQEQYNVLRILRGQYPNPTTLTLISERMIDRMSNATRLVGKLEVSGLVTRTVCEDNRRKVDILITQKGLDMLNQIEPSLRKMFDTLDKIDTNSLQELNRVLDALRD